jgi:2-C-methyl-D-erythritol 4-phosphate cytidylyltransferase
LNRGRYWAVVPAAGIGRRMHSDRPKQYLQLGRQTVIEHSLEVLLGHSRVVGAVIALATDDPYWPSLGIVHTKPLLTVAGGAERCDSVLNALRALMEQPTVEDAWALVHDAARPCLRGEDLDHLIDGVGTDPGGGLLALPVRDTLKREGPAGRVGTTVDRSGLWHALTPQLFPVAALSEALQAAIDAGHGVTDDASAMELAGHAPHLIEGQPDNIKITRPADLALAELSLRGQGRW